jgi:hypothetical protein
MRQSIQEGNRQCKRWNSEEDALLMRTVRARPQNLHRCFLMVAEQTGRTESAVAGRWYTKVSKDPANLCFFTASPKHVSKNRKNGMGVETNSNIWRRLVAVLRNIW